MMKYQYDNQILSMRLCLQWDIVRFPIGADTVYSVYFHGSTCCLCMWQPIGIVLYYFRLVVDKLFNPMGSFPLDINWSVTAQFLCNRWTECLLISLSKLYTFLYISYTICLSHFELVLLWLNKSFWTVYSELTW